jgi:S1-C subfamily serine protease
LNTDGEVIGINSAIFASAQGIGFAIPSDKVRRIVQELTRFGKVRPAWIGARVDQLDPQVAARLGWDRTYGAVVLDTEKSSPAERAGLRRGDIVAEVGGSRVTDREDFDVRMRGYPAKTPITMNVFRDGRLVPLTVVPVEFPSGLAESIFWDRAGLKVRAVEGGLTILDVRKGARADRIGLERGDIVQRINNRPMKNIESFRDAVAEARAGNSVLLLVRRGRVGYHITLPF